MHATLYQSIDTFVAKWLNSTCKIPTVFYARFYVTYTQHTWSGGPSVYTRITQCSSTQIKPASGYSK